MTDPRVLHALAALWSLDRARGYLAEHRETILIRRPQLGPVSRRPRSLAELAAYDELLRDERPDRDALAGAKMATGPAPLPPGLLDLDRDIAQALTDVAGMLAHVHRHHPLIRHTGHWDHPAIAGRWLWLLAATSVTPGGVAGEIRALIDPVDARARSIAGHGPDRAPVPLSPRCPACRLRMLRLQTSAPPDRRTLVCGNDQCWCLGPGDPHAGDGCPCDMPTRIAGERHIWAPDSTRMAEALAGARLAARGTIAA